MNNLGPVVVLFRVFIVALFAGLIFGQVVSIPGQFSHMAEEAPELGFLPWGLMVFGVLEVVCLQIILVCIWKLLTMVRSDRIFSNRSFRWVDGILLATSVGWALLVVTAVSISTFLYLTPRLRDPGLPILFFGLVLVGGVVVLTVAILRALLRQAAALRSDLDEVI